MSPRVVICPHGLPRHVEARERCCNHLLHCDGDLQRVIEGRPGDLARFVEHLGRIRGLADGVPPLVLLTRTNPLGLAVLQTRRALEDAVPELADAAWLVFVDELEDPFFMEAASRMGSVVGGDGTAQLWFAPHHQRFLILGAREIDPEVLRGRLAQLGAAARSAPGECDDAPEPDSGTRFAAARLSDAPEMLDALGTTD